MWPARTEPSRCYRLRADSADPGFILVDRAHPCLCLGATQPHSCYRSLESSQEDSCHWVRSQGWDCPHDQCPPCSSMYRLSSPAVQQGDRYADQALPQLHCQFTTSVLSCSGARSQQQKTEQEELLSKRNLPDLGLSLHSAIYMWSCVMGTSPSHWCLMVS